MKKSIVSVFMLIMFLLLSCDFDAISELIDKASTKLLDRNKDIENLNYEQYEQEEQYNQESQKDRREPEENSIKNFGEGAKLVAQIVHRDPVMPINEGSIRSGLYPFIKLIKIEEKDLVPSTDYEKEAQAGIDKVKIILGNDGFAKLIEDARELKSEYEQLESNFYNTLLHLKNKTESYPTKKDRTKRQQLIQLQNKLNDERSHIDMLRMQVDSGLSNRGSAKGLFESAQKTLKEAMTERLRNKHKSYWAKKIDSDLLAKRARSEAENALRQLESSAISIGEAMGRKKDMEKLIESAKSILGNLER